jgi:hypothetical protein
MTRESLFYKILSGIHVVFFTSLLCGGTIFLSGTLLLLPVLGGAFRIGEDVIYKRLNITDSIIRTYFRYLKESLPLLKFLPIHVLLLFNGAAMLIAGRAGNTAYSVLCLVIASFLLVFMLYLAGYHVFAGRKVNAIETAFCMLLKPQLLIPIFAVTVLAGAFFSGVLLVILLFTGTFFLFAVEEVIFIQMLYFKRLTGNLKEEDEFAYLVYGRSEKK